MIKTAEKNNDFHMNVELINLQFFMLYLLIPESIYTSKVEAKMFKVLQIHYNEQTFDI